MTENISLENKIDLLKKKIIEYEEFDDNEKINKIQEYNKIIQEKEKCSNLILDYKKSLDEIKPKKNKQKKHSNENISTLLNKMHEIKKVLELNTLPIKELIVHYQELCEIKSILEEHFKNKKMEILELR